MQGEQQPARPAPTSRAGQRTPDESTAQLTPNRGGDFIEGDVSMRETLPEPASYQSSHGVVGTGGDDERGDADDAKVRGQARP
jgi:hypothetical protein